VPQFAAEMDGLVSLENVVVILTSNRPDYIDPAILRPERIDRKVKIRRPDRHSARQIFEIYLNKELPLSPDLLKEHGDDNEKARQALVDHAMTQVFAKRLKPSSSRCTRAAAVLRLCITKTCCRARSS
jgi:proteasome-associated ATPase